MPPVTPQRIAAKNASALGTTRYLANKDPLIEHETYIPRSVQEGIKAQTILPGKQNQRPKDISLTKNGQNTLNYLARSPVKKISESAIELQRARANAIQSTTRLSTLINNREDLKQDLARITANPYNKLNPFGTGYIAQTLFSFTTWFSGTFYGDQDAKSTLAEMRAYDDKVTKLAAIEGAIPAAEYHARSDIASAKGLEKDLENAVNKIAVKDENQLSFREKILLTNLATINKGHEYVAQDVIIREATDEVLKDTPNYANVEALLKTPGLELPALSSTAQQLNREQQISYQLALAVGGKDEKLGNKLLDKAGLAAMTPSETKRLNPIAGASLATVPASFEARAESRLNTTVPPVITISKDNTNTNVLNDYVPEPPFDQAVRAIEAYFVANDQAKINRDARPEANELGQEAVRLAQAAGIPITTVVQLNILHNAKEKTGDTFDLKASLKDIQEKAKPTQAVVAHLSGNTNAQVPDTRLHSSEDIATHGSGNSSDVGSKSIKIK